MSKASECPFCGYSWISGNPVSVKARKYYRGPVLDALTAYYNRTRDLPLPVHKSFVHEEMLRAFLGLDEKGELRRSRDLDSGEFARMTDDVRAFLATKGVNVPSPDEPWEEQ